MLSEFKLAIALFLALFTGVGFRAEARDRPDPVDEYNALRSHSTDLPFLPPVKPSQFRNT